MKLLLVHSKIKNFTVLLRVKVLILWVSKLVKMNSTQEKKPEVAVEAEVEEAAEVAVVEEVEPRVLEHHSEDRDKTEVNNNHSE